MVLCLFLDVLFIHLTQLHYKLNSEKNACTNLIPIIVNGTDGIV